MVADEEGFLYPRVDAERCIGCGRCERVCPVLHPYGVRIPQRVYAAKACDTDVRMRSSSGGIFTLLAEEVIRRGGVVFGAQYDDTWQVRHAYTDTVQGLSPLRGTKYVQSIIGSTYTQARAFLKQGRWVMFVGTPCQVAGLRHFLHRDYGTLLAVEVVCHGVPSPKVWQAYLEGITPDGESVVAVDMRDKSTGWSTYGMRIATAKRVLYRGKAKHNIFSRGFLADLYLRPSCHDCPAKQGKSLADMTLGDFWGIRGVFPAMDDDRGVSLVLVHSQKGMNFYGALDVVSQETTYEQALRGNPAIGCSAAHTRWREEFWRRFPKEGMKAVHRLWWRKRIFHYFPLAKLKIT